MRKPIKGSLVLVIGMCLTLLGGCSSTGSDCALAALNQPTATSPVSQPTPMGVNPTFNYGSCPTATPRPLPTRRSVPTASAGLGKTSSATQAITLSPDSETLLGVAVAGDNRGAVVFRDVAGQIVIATTDNWGQFVVGGGNTAALAFGPGQVALISDGVFRIAPSIPLLSDSLTASLSFGGSDLAASYGPEGWLYVASGGSVQRFNPQDLRWETQANYTGQAQHLMLLASGSQLLFTTSGLYRHEVNGNFAMVWSGEAEGIAVFGNHVALARAIGNSVSVRLSEDEGRSWNEQIAMGNGAYQSAFRLFSHDGILEVTALYTQSGTSGRSAFAFPALAQLTTNGWYPPLDTNQVEGLTRNVAELQPSSNLRVVSVNGFSLAAWESRQLNGGKDVVAVVR